MPNKPLPWFKCWGGMTSDPKVAPLSDAVFRTWVELLDAASRQPHRGRFASRKQAAAVARRPLAHVAELVAERLIDETPDGLTMHDWDTWQRWRKEDAMDTGSTPDGPPDEPPNGHAMDSPSTTGSTQALLRAQGAKTLDVRRKTLDVREEDVIPPEAPPAAAEGAALAEPVPTTKRAKRVAGERTPISAEALDELVVEYGEMFPGGTPAARLAADRAMNNKARLNALDERHYVQNWLRGDLERLKANGHAAPTQDVPRRQQPPTVTEPCPECNRPIDARGDGHDQRRNLHKTPQEPDPLIACRLFGQSPVAWQKARVA